MSATYFEGDGVAVCISDAGYERLASEQRMNHATSVNTAVLIGAGAGLVVTFAALVITKILGA
ncbi:hypothetical protein [Paraburkholderia dilworthii]|uniref:hypothetical protein n=1 Tax=Paraburkholderia dilworthii TaxID=948106 RepID=UPI0004080266|nr:hypothetical protein [Paraburkholderia dilworthii]